MQQLRYFGWWLAGGCALVALIVYGSIIPPAATPVISISDKLLHFGGYLVLALWFAGLVEPYRYLVVGVALIALGGGLEIVQALMGYGRTADWWDLSANMLGVAVGLALAQVGLGSWMRAVERGFGGR